MDILGLAKKVGQNMLFSSRIDRYFNSSSEIVNPSTGLDNLSLEEEYVNSPHAWACGELLVNSCVDLPYYTGRIKPDGSISEGGNGISRIFRKPNSQYNRETFLEKVFRELLIHGSIGIIPAGENGIAGAIPSEIMSMYAVSNKTFNIQEADIEGIIAGFTYNYRTASRQYTPDDFLYIRHSINPIDSYSGIGPMHAALWPTVTSRLTAKWLAKLAKNSGLPPVLLNYKSDDIGDTISSEESLAQLQEKWMSFVSNIENRGKPFATIANVQKLALDPGEAHVIEMTQRAREDICSAFGVSPILIGDLRNSSYDNAKEAVRNFHLKTVLPLANKVCAELTMWLQKWFPGEGIAIDYSRIEVLQDEGKAYVDMLAKQVETGIIDRDEARDYLGYDAYTGEEKRVVRKSLIPVQQLNRENSNGN